MLGSHYLNTVDDDVGARSADLGTDSDVWNNTDRMEVRTECCCELCCPFDHVMSCLGGVRRNENWSGHGYILADQMTGEHQGLSCSPSFRSEQRPEPGIRGPRSSQDSTLAVAARRRPHSLPHDRRFWVPLIGTPGQGPSGPSLGVVGRPGVRRMAG